LEFQNTILLKSNIMNTTNYQTQFKRTKYTFYGLKKYTR
jgi:hypothetical protein